MTAITSIPATSNWTVDKVHSSVGFSVKHMVVQTFRGTFEDYDASLNAAEDGSLKLTGTVKAASINVKDDNLKGHLLSPEFFDVERFPAVRFTSNRITKLAGDRFKVEGTLDLRGILKPMALEVTYHGVAKDPWGNDRAGFSTEAVINRKEFGMVWNAALDNGGVILGDDVTLAIDLEMVRKG